jgi:alpha-1,6-mannosyltransferase
MGIAFILYAAACIAAPHATGKWALPIIIAGAVVSRLLMAGPVLYDNDIYRYHWDGRVLASDRNPYCYAPDDHRLAGLRDEAWERVQYKWVKTIYPPLTEALSAATSFVWASPQRIRVLAAAFDLATLVPILLILGRLGLSRSLVLIYAWNPLPIKEFANSGHLDSVAILFVTWSLYALLLSRPVPSGVLWGLGFLGKTWSALLFPLYLQRRRAVGFVAFVAVVAAGVLPFVGAGRDLFAGSLAYARDWEFNSGLFALEKAAMARLGLGGVQAAKGLNAVLWLVVAAAVARSRQSDGAELLRRAGLLIGLALVLSAVCNPWYVCWLLPILCVHRSPAWLAFTGLVMLSYLYYQDAALDPLARVIEYGAFAALLAWEALSRNQHRLWAGLRGRNPAATGAPGEKGDR